MTGHRFAVAIMPRDGILDPQGRAVEASLARLGGPRVIEVRIGRRVELTVEAADAAAAREAVMRLAADVLANPLVEQWTIEDALPEGVA